jgi:hypothetical protein
MVSIIGVEYYSGCRVLIIIRTIIITAIFELHRDKNDKDNDNELVSVCLSMCDDDDNNNGGRMSLMIMVTIL